MICLDRSPSSQIGRQYNAGGEYIDSMWVVWPTKQVSWRAQIVAQHFLLLLSLSS